MEQQRLRVALVDDHADVRELLRLTLELDGRFELVGQGRDGIEAVELAAATAPDLLLLDRQMPRMGGLEALPRIREASPHTSVILYTAYDEEGTHQAAIAAGALDVLVKSTVGAAFVDELAGVLLRHWAGGDGDVEVSMPPVPVAAALAAIDGAERLLAAVRTHPDLCDPVPEEVLDALGAFLARWRSMARGSDQFAVRAAVPAPLLESIAEAWITLAGIPAERLAARGVAVDLEVGRDFFDAMGEAVAGAIERRAAGRLLADRLRRRRG